MDIEKNIDRAVMKKKSIFRVKKNYTKKLGNANQELDITNFKDCQKLQELKRGKRSILQR